MTIQKAAFKPGTWRSSGLRPPASALHMQSARALCVCPGESTISMPPQQAHEHDGGRSFGHGIRIPCVRPDTGEDTCRRLPRRVDTLPVSTAAPFLKSNLSGGGIGGARSSSRILSETSGAQLCEAWASHIDRGLRNMETVATGGTIVQSSLWPNSVALHAVVLCGGNHASWLAAGTHQAHRREPQFPAPCQGTPSMCACALPNSSLSSRVCTWLPFPTMSIRAQGCRERADAKKSNLSRGKAVHKAISCSMSHTCTGTILGHVHQS